VRKLVVSEFVSLDGVVQDPGWTFQFESADRDQFKFDELAAAWPEMEEQTGEYGAWMNGYAKHVVSTTLEEPLEWKNSALIKGDLAEEVTRLKQQDGKDVLVFGSGELVRSLMNQDLVDEYRLMVFPVVVGSGKRLFGEGDTKTLKLVGTQTFDSGAVVLTYEPADE
jgi:dihydrofolate reductase